MPVDLNEGVIVSMRILGLLVLTATLAFAGRAQAAQSYDNCSGFITALPAIISSQGTWCFKQDLSMSATSGVAVTINTSNVTVDCNGYKLGGLAAGAGTATYGIYASGRQNITVRRCNVRGFYAGVDVVGSSGSGHVIEDNQFDGNTTFGILVQGTGSIVRHNRVFDTGGGTGSVLDAMGIYVTGSVDVTDNLVFGVTPKPAGNGNAFGIYTSGLTGSGILRNGVRATVGDGSGHGYGIYNPDSDRLSIRDNDLVGNGDAGSIGLYCANDHGRAVDNNVSHYATGISFCANVSGNNTIP